VRPEDILVAYLHRPIAGFSFRWGLEQVARGRFRQGPSPRLLPDRELVSRAQAMLRWLDGKDPELRNPYEALGLGRLASRKEVAHRYRTLSKRVHPDRHGPDRQMYWAARQDEINRAYRILLDPELRAQWAADDERRRQLLRRLRAIEDAAHR
jgi:hypothetical protein